MIGSLDIEALHQALNALLNRHEVLRTTISSDGGRVVQTVGESRAIELAIADLGVRRTETQDEALDDFIKEQARRPFDLAHDVMLRATLVRVSDSDHVLVLILHHIATDGWSSGILTRELSTIYNATRDGVQPRLDELPIQYADYSVWQSAKLTDEKLRGQMAFWSRHLDGAPDVLELPGDRVRQEPWSFDGARHSFQFSPHLSDSLRRLGREANTTLFATVLAAFATLLSRLSGTYDIVLGTPIAGRRCVETERLIGFFVNTLALRIDLSGDPSFRELLGHVHDVACEAFTNQDMPFEKLVQQLRPQRFLGRSPLFHVMFVLQNAPRSRLDLKDLETRKLTAHNGTTKFDLTISLVDAPEGIRGHMVYSTEVFDSASIRRICSQFETLLTAIVADLGCPISELPLLSKSDYEQVRDRWNATARDFPRDATVHELFAKQAATGPDAVAVADGELTLTYARLDAMADRLASRLRASGVGLEDCVALLLPRSPGLIAALLAILKAGAAYVPLDTRQPWTRNRFLLVDCRAKVLITTKDQDLPCDDGGPEILRIDTGDASSSVSVVGTEAERPHGSRRTTWPM